MNEYLDIAECKVTASYDNNKVTAESKVLTIKPTTLSLNFMRYLPAKSQRKESFLYPLRESETKYNVDGAPQIKDWDYKASSLREGYLYLYFENKPDLFKEFKVELTGLLTNIITDLSTDVRTQTDSYSKKYYCVSTKDVIWIAYSEYQWSAKYIRKIRNEASVREKRMQKFDGPSFTEGNEIPNTFSVNEIDGYFPLSDIDTSPKKTKDHGSIYWTPGHFTNGMDAYLIQDWKGYYDNVKVLEDKPDEQTEVFFCLHDPVGCADELAIELQNIWDYMEAIIISMQTGLDRQVVYKEIVKGNKEPDNLSHKDLLKKTELLHKSLLLLYQAGFCSEENINKYGKHLDRKRMETMLAKDERQKCREKVLEAKNQLTSFLESEYYKNRVLEYSAHTPEIKLQGKARISLHLSNLQYRINAKDHVYNLSEDNDAISRQNDKGFNYAKDTFEKGQGLLFEKVDIELKEGADNLNRIILTWNTLSGGIADFATKYPKFITTQINMLNGVRVFKNGELIVEECFDIVTIQKVVKNKKPFLDAGKQMVNITDDLLEDLRFLRAVDGSAINIEQVSISQKFNAAFQREGKLYDITDHLTNSLAWNRFVAQVAIINLGSATFQLFRKSDKNHELFRNSLVTLSSLAGVVETQATYKILSRKIAGEISKDVSEKLMKGLPTKAAVVGIWITSSIDLMDAGVNFYRGDYDAAALQGLGAILSVTATIGMLNNWNPVGWVSLLAAGTAFSILSIFFEDGPLEELCNNCQFRQKKFFVIFDSEEFDLEGPFEKSIRHHRTMAHTMVKRGFEQWADYMFFYEHLSDILFGGVVIIESKPNVITSRVIGATTLREHFKKELYVKVHFNMAKMCVADIHLEIFLYPNGLVVGQSGILLTKESDKGNLRIIQQTNPDAEYFVALFDIPEAYLPDPQKRIFHKHAEILILCRCQDHAHAFPINRNEQPRYIAVREKLYREENIVHQARTPFNSRLIDRDEKDRELRLVKTVFAGDQIRRGFENELKSPID